METIPEQIPQGKNQSAEKAGYVGAIDQPLRNEGQSTGPVLRKVLSSCSGLTISDFPGYVSVK